MSSAKQVQEERLRIILREYRDKYRQAPSFIASTHKDRMGMSSNHVDIAELNLLQKQIDKLTIKSILEVVK